MLLGGSQYHLSLPGSLIVMMLPRQSGAGPSAGINLHLALLPSGPGGTECVPGLWRLEERRKIDVSFCLPSFLTADTSNGRKHRYPTVKRTLSYSYTGLPRSRRTRREGERCRRGERPPDRAEVLRACWCCSLQKQRQQQQKHRNTMAKACE